MAKIRQLLLLIWKNFKLQIRHPFVTALELVVPAFFSCILVLIRSVISSEHVDNPTIYEPFSINTLPKNLTPSSLDSNEWRLLYTPNTTFISNLMEGVGKDLNCSILGFEKENVMVTYYSRQSTACLAGVVFDDNLKFGMNHTNEFNYKIRPRKAEPPNNFLMSSLTLWYTDMAFPLYPALGPRNRESNWGGNPGYMSRGFLPIQHAVATNFIKELDPNFPRSFNYDLMMSRYPYPPYLDDKFILAMTLFFPMIICFSFIYPSVNLVKNVVVEKEKRIKEAMKMMGLSKWLHWTAWYLKYLLFLFISCCIITLLLCLKFNNIAVINRSDPSLILLWLVIYTSSFIAFCFFLSTLFNKANSASAGAGIIFFVSFVPYFFILPRYLEISYATKIFCCLVPNLSLSIGSIILTASEAIGNGIQWNNFHLPPTPDTDLPMSTVMFMSIVDILLFLILTWYIEAVFPGEYGVPEKWYFPFTHSYWCGDVSSDSEIVQFYNSDTKLIEFYEEDPVELMPGIQIQNLTKVFDKNIPAVNNLNVNMYRGHITVLLGHNGAGKTTTISMLTGLITSTSGTAIVNGFDICEDMDGVHSSLGICPQHDILFDELTVEEHLYFFCKLKGYLSDLVSSEIERIINSLGLEQYRETQTMCLSGGWKRKVSVAIAFVGGSRIVILDEPTSGMDPFNRRALWEVLQTEKEDRTILLTTHFMEEADALGDRIGILSHGEMQCLGSPLFLKKKYGAGYHLVMVKEPDCDVSLVTKIIISHVPNAEETSNIGSELKYILPTESCHLFSNLFAELDRRRNELNISSYGASITTMEEVFIKVGKNAEKILNDKAESVENRIPFKESLSSADSGIQINTAFTDDNGIEVDLQSLTEYQPHERNIGFKLYFQHLNALLIIRILHSFRNSSHILSQILVPPFCLILTLLILKTIPLPKDGPPLLLGTYSYKGTEIPYLVDADSESMTLGDMFASQYSGLDIPVMLNSSTTNMNAYLINEGKQDVGKYNMHNMIAAKFKKSKGKGRVTAFFNNKAYHTPAVALLGVDNAILKYVVNKSYTFLVTNHPMPRSIAEKGKQEQVQSTEPYQIAQSIMFGMSFLVASFSVYIVKERASNMKHLQRVSGMNLSSYWLSSFLWDYLNYVIPCCLIFLVFISFQTKGFSSSIEIGRLLLLFFIHGFAVLPFIYCATFMFKSPSTAYVRISIFSIVVGIACLLTITILEIPDLGVQYVAKHLDTLFSLLLPNYSLGRAISNLYQNTQFNKYCNVEIVLNACKVKGTPYFDLVKPCCKGKCENECLNWEANFFSLNRPGIGQQLISFAVQFVLFTVVLILCELNFARFIKYKLKRRKVVPSNPSEASEIDSVEEDNDVCNERMKILNTPIRQLFSMNHVIIKELFKKYESLVSVNKISFGVQKGECFGLLGSNGAGKTTTFKMITGETTISSGEIYVDGYNVKKQSRKVQGRIGYCPQFDALIDDLTGRETLTLFCHLRGIPKHEIPEQIKSYSDLLSFSAHIDKLVKHYSGGNKRKLSTAVALIGNSPVIFLDEPTTGMDPVSRRCMWHALLQIIQSGRSIILTSHSMEECEALCTRLVIMVNGRLCCLGSPQHLKTKFGQGFSLIIKIGRRPQAMSIRLSDTLQHVQGHPAPSGDPRTGAVRDFAPIENVLKTDMDEVKAFVKNTFPSATLRSAHENQIHFHIPSTGMSWAEIFGAMERARSSLNIEDYTVGETTLEQIFLHFAMAQRPDERV